MFHFLREQRTDTAYSMFNRLSKPLMKTTHPVLPLLTPFYNDYLPLNTLIFPNTLHLSTIPPSLKQPVFLCPCTLFKVKEGSPYTIFFCAKSLIQDLTEIFVI